MYADIEAYHSLSGVRWNNERGAGIEGEAARAVWNTFLQSSVSAPISDVFQYYNKHFNALAAILWHNTPIPQRWLGILYAGVSHFAEQSWRSGSSCLSSGVSCCISPSWRYA